VVAPAPDAGPYLVDGVWLSLWEHVEVVDDEPSAAVVGGALRDLHDALAGYPGPLGRPLHGDASLSNLLTTTRGVRWNDFEDVCLGNPAWDAAGLIADARRRRGDRYAAAVARAYGRELHPHAVQLVTAADALYGALWRAFI
jgi:thiamine kinase-like enzyme